ncbi:MAG: Crp/Fnr family transcriptional regulator [Deltaproteobacteria bacterium]|nr:Crp/Fnr family transcriptional regulator [Deltaproteobacteria bacterium]
MGTHSRIPVRNHPKACLCQEIAGKDIALSPICIGQLWIFQNLDAEEIEALSRDALRKKMSKGQALFMQGDPADEMFLIKGGRIKLNKVLEDGAEITLDIRKAGDFVGENMFSEEVEYPVSAYCLEDTLTCGFSKGQFERLVLKHPNVGLQIIKNLSERIAWLTSRVGSLAVTNIEDRLYRVLATVAREHGASSSRGLAIQFPLTHEDLGFLTGAHRVSITRAMKALKRSGKIIHEGKNLILPALNLA